MNTSVAQSQRHLDTPYISSKDSQLHLHHTVSFGKTTQPSVITVRVNNRLPFMSPVAQTDNAVGVNYA